MTSDAKSPGLAATPRAKEYHRRRMYLGAVGLGFEVGYLITLVFLGLSHDLAGAARALADGRGLQLLVFGLLFMLLSECFSLPVAFMRGHVLERQYGLSRQNWRAWLADHGKAFGLNLVFTLLLIEILYAFIWFGGERWWVWTGVVFSVIFIIMARLAPVLIFPLFFKFTPLPAGELRERLLQLAAKARASVRGIFEMDLSRKSNTVNAALAGIGRSRRIILSDTLLQRFPADEVEVVVAHELGHHLHRHLLKGIVVQTAATFLFLFLVDQLAGHVAMRLGYAGLGDIAALPILALAAVVMGLLGTAPLNATLRHFERQADRCAIELTGMPEAFASTMRRLASLNMADPAPHPLVEMLFYSHPSIQRRLDFAEKFRQETGVDSCS